MRTLLFASVLNLGLTTFVNAEEPGTTFNMNLYPPREPLTDCVYDYANHQRCGYGVHPGTPPQMRTDVAPGAYVDNYGNIYPSAAHTICYGEDPEGPIPSRAHVCSWLTKARSHP